MSAIDFHRLPRLLQELCGGHPGYSVAVYKLTLPNGVVEWLCQYCWIRTWEAHGCQEQQMREAS